MNQKNLLVEFKDLATSNLSFNRNQKKTNFNSWV